MSRYTSQTAMIVAIAARAQATGPSRRRVLALLGAGALAGCTTRSQVGITSHINFAPPPASDPEPLFQGTPAAAAALARGGYVIYLRHGRTLYDQIEMERTNRNNGSFDIAKCETQRALSDVGRAELKKAGEQFRLARIPLDGVFSSRYCRAIEQPFHDGPRRHLLGGHRLLGAGSACRGARPDEPAGHRRPHHARGVGQHRLAAAAVPHAQASAS